MLQLEAKSQVNEDILEIIRYIQIMQNIKDKQHLAILSRLKIFK